MDFGGALSALKKAMFVTREGWNGKGQYLGAQFPDSGSKNTLPYIYIITVSGDRVPWLASQTDVLAEDWKVVHICACGKTQNKPFCDGSHSK